MMRETSLSHVVVGEGAAPGDRADGEDGAAVGSLEIDHVGADEWACRAAPLAVGGERSPR